MAKKEKPANSWRDIRAILSKADDSEVLKLVGELYALRKENQDFLHARYLKDADILVPYKETIARYISPAEPWKNPVKTSLARKAISDYRKAVGDPEKLTELMLFYVECGVGHILDWDDNDDAMQNSIFRVFAEGMETLDRCEKDVAGKLLPRFEAVVQSTANMNWGFYEALRDTFEIYAPDV